MTKSKKTLAILAIVVILIAAAAIAVNGNAAVARLAGQEVTAGDVEGRIEEAEFIHQFASDYSVPTPEEAAEEEAYFAFLPEELARRGYTPTQEELDEAASYTKTMREYAYQSTDEDTKDLRDMWAKQMELRGWTYEEFEAAMEKRYLTSLTFIRYANEEFDGDREAAGLPLREAFKAAIAAEQGEASLDTEPGTSSGDTEVEPVPEPSSEK